MIDLNPLLSSFDFVTLLEHAFYPVLFSLFVIASLGVPIPEDIPLLAAGMLLNTHPNIATWTGTITVSLIGIMSGDLILYTLGRTWGPTLFEHRWTRWIMTPKRFEVMKRRFHRWGVWMVFFGRFVVGIRAIMCMTAGATRFPYWKFFIADFCGAVITVILFLQLGYMFADMLPTVKAWLGPAHWIVLILVLLGIGGFILWEIRRNRRFYEAQSRRAAATQARNDRSAPAFVNGDKPSSAIDDSDLADQPPKPHVPAISGNPATPILETK